jgi:hypothetical protein
MRPPPWPLSLVLPLCTTDGGSSVPTPDLVDFQPLARALHRGALLRSSFNAAFPPHPAANSPALHAYLVREQGVNLARVKPIATALQQKVSD